MTYQENKKDDKIELTRKINLCLLKFKHEYFIAKYNNLYQIKYSVHAHEKRLSDNNAINFSSGDNL